MSSLTYSEKLRDPRWQKKRLEVFNRDNFTCLDCSRRNQTLHVHHCYYSKGGPWETPLELLMTLCGNCHAYRQFQEERVKLALAKILRGQMCNGSFDAIERLAVQMEKLAASEEPSPVFIEETDYDHETDLRWYFYACYHPSARKTYQDVVGRKVKWASSSKPKKSP